MWTLLEMTDNRLFWFCHRCMHCVLLDRLLLPLTHLGSAGATITITLLTLVLGVAMGLEAVWKAGAAMAVSLLVSHLVVHSIKRKVNRPRPRSVMDGIRFFEVPICPYSFPSGHTNAAFAVAIPLYCHLPVLGLPLLVLAALTGFSRVYLGVHYASDVLAGAVIGISAGLLAGLLG